MIRAQHPIIALVESPIPRLAAFVWIKSAQILDDFNGFSVPR
jgi:hypothetical protein